MSEENQESFVEEVSTPPEPQSGYAILKSGVGCRAVASENEISENETFSLIPQSGYAIRNDQRGFRCVASIDDILDDETFGLELPPSGQPTSEWLSSQDGIKFQIKNLEETITPRRLREAVLGTDNGWLANIEDQIEDLRAQLS